MVGLLGGSRCARGTAAAPRPRSPAPVCMHGLDPRADVRPDLRPHLARRAAERPRVLLAERVAPVGVVAEERQLRPPRHPHREARGEQRPGRCSPGCAATASGGPSGVAAQSTASRSRPDLARRRSRAARASPLGHRGHASAALVAGRRRCRAPSMSPESSRMRWTRRRARRRRPRSGSSCSCARLCWPTITPEPARVHERDLAQVEHDESAPARARVEQRLPQLAATSTRSISPPRRRRRRRPRDS